MTSLSTDAGQPNPNNFHREVLDYSDVERKDFINGALVTTANTGTRHRDQYTEIFSGRVLDKFHQRKNSGELLPYTNYIKVSKSISSRSAPYPTEAGWTAANGTVYTHQWRYRDGSRKSFLGLATLDNATLTFAEAEIAAQGIDPMILVQQAAAKLYSRGWDGLTFLAEFHQVLRMFKRLVPNVIKLVLELKTFLKTLDNKTELTSDIVNAWLQGRYGWRILIYDIEDINKLIDKIDTEESSRCREVEKFERNWTRTAISNPSGGNHSVSHTSLYNFKLGVRGTIIADFLPSRVSFNPVVTSYELITLGFVLDWVVNIGMALEAVSFIATNHQYTACTGVSLNWTRDVTTQVVINPVGWPNGWSNWNQISFSEKAEVIRRDVRYVPILPFYNLNLSVFKVADLVALLTQAVIQITRR